MDAAKAVGVIFLMLFVALPLAFLVVALVLTLAVYAATGYTVSLAEWGTLLALVAVPVLWWAGRPKVW